MAAPEREGSSSRRPSRDPKPDRFRAKMGVRPKIPGVFLGVCSEKAAKIGRPEHDLSHYVTPSWPGWIRTTTAGSKDRCPAIRRRAKKPVVLPTSLSRRWMYPIETTRSAYGTRTEGQVSRLSFRPQEEPDRPVGVVCCSIGTGSS